MASGFRSSTRVQWVLERGERPPIPKSSTPFLKVPSAALLLEAARTYPRTKREPEMAIAHTVLATLVLTGGLKSEVLGLEINDISFDRKTVTFRPNQWRGKDGRGRDRLKTASSERVVPLWPQLEELLRPHVWERLQAGGSLLFPSPYMSPEAPLGDLRDMLDRVAVRAGFPKGRVRARMLRVTYATARLQTLDRGAPVAHWTVERELGHGSGKMLEAVYGRLVRFGTDRKSSSTASTSTSSGGGPDHDADGRRGIRTIGAHHRGCSRSRGGVSCTQ